MASFPIRCHIVDHGAVGVAEGFSAGEDAKIPATVGSCERKQHGRQLPEPLKRGGLVEIHGVIPGSEVRNRFEVLNQLWGLLARADVSLDLLLYSRQECEGRRHWRSHVIGRAYREGRLLDGAL